MRRRAGRPRRASGTARSACPIWICWASAPPASSLPARLRRASAENAAGFWGVGREVSKGKDTPSGHWEIAGVPVPFEWGYFPKDEPAFPKELTDAIIS